MRGEDKKSELQKMFFFKKRNQEKKTEHLLQDENTTTVPGLVLPTPPLLAPALPFLKRNKSMM